MGSLRVAVPTSRCFLSGGGYGYTSAIQWLVSSVSLCRGIPNYNFEKGKITFKRNLNKSNNSHVSTLRI